MFLTLPDGCLGIKHYLLRKLQGHKTVCLNNLRFLQTAESQGGQDIFLQKPLDKDQIMVKRKCIDFSPNRFSRQSPMLVLQRSHVHMVP